MIISRFKKSESVILLAALLAGSTNVFSADEEKKSPWTNSAEFGLIRTTGNTETETTKLKADIAYEVDKWRHSGHADAYGQKAKNDTSGESEVSAERYELSAKSDYKFSEKDYGFGLIKLQKDRFSGFKYEHVASLGYGNKTIQQKNMELDLEVGPGVRFFKEDDDPLLPAKGDKTEGILVLAAKYWWNITENSKFTQELSTDVGEEFTSSKSVTGIQANINSTLALKFTYTIRNKSKVPEGTEKTDTEAAMVLVYSY